MNCCGTYLDSRPWVSKTNMYAIKASWPPRNTTMLTRPPCPQDMVGGMEGNTDTRLELVNKISFILDSVPDLVDNGKHT